MTSGLHLRRRFLTALVVTAAASFLGLARTGSLRAEAAAPAIEDSTAAIARLDTLQKAIADAEQAVEADPKNWVPWTRLARAWFATGNHARGKQALEQALVKGGGREFEPLLLLGRAHCTEAHFPDAERVLRRALRVQPGSAEAHEALGLALYLEGQYAAAVAEWRLAASLPGASPEAPAGWLTVLERASQGAYAVIGPAQSRVPFLKRGGTSNTRTTPSVEVRIHGRGPWAMQIGTANAELVIGRALANELKLAVVPGGAASPALDYAILDSLRLGAFTIRRVPCAISDDARFAERGVSGAIGLELLRRFRFCLDYPDRALVLEARPSAADTTRPSWVRPGDVAHEVPLLIQGTHRILAEGSIANAPKHPILIEPGLPGVGFAAARSALAEAQVPMTGIAPLTGRLGGAPVSYTPLPATKVCVGPACVDDLTGVYGVFPEALERNPDFRIAALVSDGFLSRYRYGVDLNGGRIWLIEPARSP
jgi:tetratricopeptide (TPR) repeat protein